MQPNIKISRFTEHGLIIVDMNYLREGDVIFYRDRKVNITSEPMSFGPNEWKYRVNPNMEFFPGDYVSTKHQHDITVIKPKAVEKNHNSWYFKEGNTIDDKPFLIIEEWELVPTLENMVYWDKLSNRNWIQKLLNIGV